MASKRPRSSLVDSGDASPSKKKPCQSSHLSASAKEPLKMAVSYRERQSLNSHVDLAERRSREHFLQTGKVVESDADQDHYECLLSEQNRHLYWELRKYGWLPNLKFIKMN